jgi:hypothetical protein
MMWRNKASHRRNSRGYALILFMLAILAVMSVIAINKLGNSLTSGERQVTQAKATNDILVAAKAALLGYVVQKTDGGAGFRLANLPTPDILNAAANGIQYDGLSDDDHCLSTATNGIPGVTAGSTTRKSTQRCLGKFPWRSLNVDVGNPEAYDPFGSVPWLAISANLNYWDQCLAKLNSDTLNWVLSAGTSCPAPANTLPYAWMRVVDSSGAILSNRVAAVLIMPGLPIQTGGRTQSRTPSSPGFSSDYLDAISVPLGCTTTCSATYDNANLSNTFIQIASDTKYPVNSESAALAGKPIAFNDALIYITIDELMVYVERRVLSEMKASLINYYKTTGIGKYPWMAPFVSPTNISSFNSAAPTPFGLFPLTVMPLAGASAPAVLTDFDWSISGVTLSKKCVSIGSGLYIDQREFIIDSYKDGVASGNTATCNWKLNGPKAVACDYISSAPPSTTKIFSTYGSSTCTGSVVGTSTNKLVPTSISLTVDSECATQPESYSAPTASDFSRWNWQCATVPGGSAFQVFQVDVDYSVTTIGGTVLGASESVRINGQTHPASLKRMRYQALMPYWFYSNDWYLSAFAAVSPSDAPSVVMPCGSATKLTVGANTNVAALVMLAGSRLPNLPSTATQTRPSSAVSNYLEAPNTSGGTNCLFSASGDTVTASRNDQVLVVAP